MAKTGKQSRSRKQEFVGKGKVTPVQIAFLVDRYLSDNSYTHTRSTFRSEASGLIAKSPFQEAPKSLLSLSAIVDEYIMLKERKVLVDQEQRRLAQEKLRVQNLLSGMQSVMNVYNASGNSAVTPPQPLPPPADGSCATASQAEVGASRPTNHYPKNDSAALILNIQKDPASFSTPVPHQATSKRKEFKDVAYHPMVSKKSRKCSQTRDDNLVTKLSITENNHEKFLLSSAAQSPARDNAPNGSQVQGPNVVKCLFNEEAISSPANSSVPKTPSRPSSSQTEKSASPLEVCSTATSMKDNNNIQPVMSANCVIISSETIRVSPNKQISYYSIEENQITCSPLKTNTKDHIKGRLDFGTSELVTATENQSPNGTSTSESEGGDILDLDLDALGLDFNISEFMVDFDMKSEELGLSSSKGVLDYSRDFHSWSPSTSANVEMGSGQIISEFSSTKKGFTEDKDMNYLGSDSVAAMRSFTKCITLVSPVKHQRSNIVQENA